MSDPHCSKTAAKRIKLVADAKETATAADLRAARPARPGCTAQQRRARSLRAAARTVAAAARPAQLLRQRVPRLGVGERRERAAPRVPRARPAIGCPATAPARCSRSAPARARLSYDFHRRYRPGLSIALDLNPLLVLLGEPRDSGPQRAVLRVPDSASRSGLVRGAAQLRGAGGATGDAPAELLRWCSATARSRRFAKGASTPCSRPGTSTSSRRISRLRAHRQSAPQGRRRVAQHGLARVLPPQRGVVLQRGREPRAARAPTASRYWPRSATRSPTCNRRRAPMAASSAPSASARAKSRQSSVPRPTPHLPQWVREPSRPVPDLDEFVVASATHLLKAQALAAVDGRRTIDEIAAHVAKRYGLQKSEARGAVERILLEIFEAAGLDKTGRRGSPGRVTPCAGAAIAARGRRTRARGPFRRASSAYSSCAPSPPYRACPR